MSDKLSGKFEIIKKTSFDELVEGQVVELPESDLAIQNEKFLLQFKYIRPDEDAKLEIKPGTFRLTSSMAGVVLNKIELTNEPLLETINNTSSIIKEAKKFFSRLHVYKKRNRQMKRGVLLYSPPGMGKSQAIKKFCRELIAEDSGTVVFIWPTSEIEADDVSKFLSIRSMFLPECTRLILVVEDIGGGERDGDNGRMAVDSGLLDLLDGQGVNFKLPTFIVATTNHPENLLASLADRPGRFDLVMELKAPSYEERCALVEFIAGHPLDDITRVALKSRGAESFSIAHLNEVVIRADLDDKTYAQVIQELVDHSKRFAKAFEDKRATGFALDQNPDSYKGYMYSLLSITLVDVVFQFAVFQLITRVLKFPMNPKLYALGCLAGWLFFTLPKYS